MFRGLYISPLLSDSDFDLAGTAFDFNSNGSRYSLFALERDPNPNNMCDVMRTLAEKGYTLYLNAVSQDEELGYDEYFGFNEKLDWNRPTCPLEEVRVWTDVELFNESMFELIMILHHLPNDWTKGHELAMSLRERMTSELASAMFDECHQIHSSDLAVSDDFHVELWRKNLGILATILLRVCIPASLEIESKTEEYLLSQYHFYEPLLTDDDTVRDQAIGIARLADVFGSEKAAGFLFPIVPADILPILCDWGVVVRPMFRWAHDNILEGCGADQLAKLFGSFEKLLAVMPKLIQVAVKDGDQVGIDVVHAVSSDCRERDAEAFLDFSKKHPEVLEMANAFQRRIDNNDW